MLTASVIRSIIALPLLVVGVTVLGCRAAPRVGDGSVPRVITAGPSAIAAVATPGDGIYSPLGNVDDELRLAVDVQDIRALTNAANEGRPLPVDAIFAIYQHSRNLRGTGAVPSLRAFARAEARGLDFPEAALFFGSNTFLDDTVIDTVTATGSATGYTPAQQRAATQQALQRLLYYASLQQLRGAIPQIESRAVDPAAGAPHQVDAAWAIAVGFPDGGSYPRSLAAAARRAEARFHREGAIDRPLREALARAQRAAAVASMSEFSAAQREVEGRLAAIFYLDTVGQLDDAVRAAEAGDKERAQESQAAGLHSYMTIQPLVARADPAADLSVVRSFRADPAGLSSARRDDTVNALNRTLTALGLTDQDRVTRANFRS